MNSTLHAFSVDVEDWYQSSYDFNAPITELCLNNTRIVLDFLSRCDIKGTFFVQGMVANKYPGLIKEIDEKGHEVQSHGFSHRPVNKMTPAEFKNELKETSKHLEDITGKPVTGFRAPDFTIDENSFWAFEVMYECGIRYDSSIFPVKTGRYGIAGFERGYSLIITPSGDIEELPVSVLNLTWPRGRRIPVGGGGYFRLFPMRFLLYSLKRLDKEGLPFIIYCHPYEFNTQEWNQILKHVSLMKRLHQGIGRSSIKDKITGLLKAGPFSSMSDVLQKLREQKGSIYAHSVL